MAKLSPDEGSITDAGAVSIANAPHWDGLEELHLVGNNAITRSAKRKIEARFGKDFIDRVR